MVYKISQEVDALPLFLYGFELTYVIHGIIKLWYVPHLWFHSQFIWDTRLFDDKGRQNKHSMITLMRYDRIQLHYEIWNLWKQPHNTQPERGIQFRVGIDFYWELKVMPCSRVWNTIMTCRRKARNPMRPFCWKKNYCHGDHRVLMGDVLMGGGGGLAVDLEWKNVLFGHQFTR